MTTMVNRAEAAKGAATAEKPSASNGAHAADKNGAAAAAASAPGSGGGIKAMLPLIANVVLMPVLAYAMTAYVLVPKLAKKTGASTEASAPAKSEGHGGSEAKSEEGHGGGSSAGQINGKTKVSVPLSKKTLVNVSGTMGTRYLLAEFILVGTGPNFKDAVEKADAELRDAAASCLSVKSISDLEKPGIRNLIRSELITVFNSILGKGTVQEIYLTEFAIQ